MFKSVSIENLTAPFVYPDLLAAARRFLQIKYRKINHFSKQKKRIHAQIIFDQKFIQTIRAR